MGRAAGDSHVYSWRLKGTRKGVTYSIDFPANTHIIKQVKRVLGFEGMAWWGYKLGIRAIHPDADDDEIEELYEAAKKTDLTPNKVRDDAAERGTGAHDLMEAAALGLAEITLDGDTYIVTAEPDVLADIVFGKADRSPAKKKWRKDKITEYEPEEHRLGAARWWLDQEQEIVFAERTVWSVRYGFQGTLDLGRRALYVPAVIPDPENGLEIIDFKTHKPSPGARKDGSYREGEGPAYADDLLQLDGYLISVEEMDLGKVVSTRVVLFDEFGDYHEDTRMLPRGTFLRIKSVHDVVCRKPECMLLARAYGGGD